MPESNYNTIPPVENPHNVPGLTPANRHQQRKQQQRSPANPNGETEEYLSPKQKERNSKQDTSNQNDRHSIDYCA